MQYLEDIVELIEDIPEEICKRFELIRKWDSDVERLQVECSYAAKRILEVTETSEAMREKILMELADKYRLIHRLSERKLELAARSERLMSAVLEKVTDSSYLCKIELEVDNPGCTEAIERNFCRMLGLRPTSSHLANCNMEFEPIDDIESTSSFQEEQDFYGRSSPPDSKDGVFPSISNGIADSERLESYSPAYGSPQRSHACVPRSKRRKYRVDSSQHTMANRVRKKQREKFKGSKFNAARSEDRNKHQKGSLTLAEPDMAFCCGNGSDSADITVKAELVDPSEGDKWKDQDALCSEDDFDANDVLDLFPSLPSPPREIMESLNEDCLFPDDYNVFYDPHSKDYPQSPPMPGILVDSFPSSPSPSASVASWDKKKRTNISFGNVNETTSLHGRQRKMTERAVKLLRNHKGREQLKRKVDVMDTDADEKWCFCREGSSGFMIFCDDPECKYQWFHIDCVGLTVVPRGKWFCSECSAKEQ